MDTVTLSFPGLGIGEFTIHKIALSLGSLTVRWYAIMIVLGILTAYLYACRRARTNGLTADDMTDVTLYTVIAGIVGARLYYVLSKLDNYRNFWDWFKIWEGGIGIYGALIGGGLALFIVSRIKKISWLAVFDTAAPGVLIAQGIGRWGNFFNGEAFGVAPAEGSLLWPFRMTVQQAGWAEARLAQPCFFYESLWCVLGFILINIFYRYKKYHGQIFLEYVVWYSFGRMFIEGLRTDSLYLFNSESLPRKSQLLALILVLAGVTLMIICGLSSRKKAAAGEYTGVYTKCAEAVSAASEEAARKAETVYEQLVREKEEDAAAKAPEASDPSGEAALPPEQPEQSAEPEQPEKQKKQKKPKEPKQPKEPKKPKEPKHPKSENKKEDPES